MDHPSSRRLLASCARLRWRSVRLIARRVRVGLGATHRRVAHGSRRAMVLARQLPDDGLPAWQLESGGEQRRRQLRLAWLSRASGMAAMALLVAVALVSGGHWVVRLDLDVRRQAVETVVLAGRVGEDGALQQRDLVNAATLVHGGGAAGELAWVSSPWADACLQLRAQQGQVVAVTGRVHNQVCLASSGR